ncbi:MAG: cysteine desulfurase, partial [Verrucomicrobia bacterium]|nr:cysteine desulfurase [Verrucomicrobiota bacterium]
MRQVYLDHQSSTPLLPEARSAMQPFFSEAFGSPSSLHRHGLRVRDALAAARAQVAALVKARSTDDIIFTSGGTEAANLAVQGVAYASQRRGNHIVLSAVEHPAVENTVAFLEHHGFAATRVRVDAEGLLDPTDVRAALTDKTILICAHWANHDLGTLQPVLELGRVAAAAGIPLFIDASTAAGWVPIDAPGFGVSLLSLTAHRFYGPKGVGALYRGKGVRLVGVQHGGAQEGGRRAGTENVPAIVGGGVAAEFAARELPRRSAHTARLQRRLWAGLQGRIDRLRLNGPEPGPRRLSTSLNTSAEFVEGEGWMLLADVNGIAVASGTSCVSKALKISPVLAAIGLDPALAQGSILMSLGKDNTDDEIDYVVETFDKIVDKLRRMSPTW